MTIHAGPYITRTIEHHLWWAKQFRRDADEAEARALALRGRAIEAEKKAAEMASGTDFNQSSQTIG